VPEGGRYEYEFTVVNRAGTYWYHPHPHGLTGPQVYAGMAGLLLVGDDEEDALSLPSGEFELPMVLQDRTFDGDRLVYLPNGMMDQMMGFLGDEILVNGRPDAVFSVAARSYRLRILNGSNARIYKLGWDDGTPLVVVATDGGLLEAPVTRPYVTLGPAERVDLWVDFEPDAIGTTRRLVSLPFESDQMMGGMMDSNALIPNGSAFDVASFEVDRDASSTDPLPEHLSDLGLSSIDDAVNPTAARTIVLSFARGTWMLNGRPSR
jgi:blue copper oxidase